MFGSNVSPTKFGKGRYPAKSWECLCDTTNSSWSSKCNMCGLERNFVLESKDKINKKL